MRTGKSSTAVLVPLFLALAGFVSATILPWLMFARVGTGLLVIIVILVVASFCVVSSSLYIRPFLAKKGSVESGAIAAPVYCLILFAGIFCLGIAYSFSSGPFGIIVLLISILSGSVFTIQCLMVRRRLDGR